MAADYVIGVCPNCAEIQYRSTRPLDPAIDRLSPDVFAPLREDLPPPIEGQPAVCIECGAQLRFAAETEFKAKSQRGADVGVPERYPDTAVRSGVETLFEVREGEKLIKVETTRDGSTLIVTDQRALRLSL